MAVDADVIAREVLVTVPEVMRTIRVEMRRRRRSDLSVMQFRSLVFLNIYPGASLSALAEHLGLTLPTVSQMVNGLVQKGVVTRLESSHDRRRVMLSLTSPGRSLLEDSFAGTQAHLVEILSSLGNEDIQTVHHVMLLLDELFCQPNPNKSIEKRQQPYP